LERKGRKRRRKITERIGIRMMIMERKGRRRTKMRKCIIK
jgi:hypothetical protein